MMIEIDASIKSLIVHGLWLMYTCMFNAIKWINCNSCMSFGFYPLHIQVFWSFLVLYGASPKVGETKLRLKGNFILNMSNINHMCNTKCDRSGSKY
jgi:hypothetical protein